MLKFLKNIFSSGKLPRNPPILTTKPEKPEKPMIPVRPKIIKELDFHQMHPRARPGTYQALIDNFEKYKINTPERVAAFISQCAHESGGFRVTTENLNYSASALNTVFAKYFKNVGRDANRYARKPEEIANIVYANRMGNGNTASGEGWKFRGRGFIQLTGKNNYQAFANSLEGKPDYIMSTPDVVATDIELCVQSAMWYWDTHNLNSLADLGDVKRITRVINGGYNGLEDRQNRYNALMELVQ